VNEADGFATRREAIQSRLADAYREIDRLIVTVSSAVLALSVAFLQWVQLPEALPLAIICWVSLLIAILLVLLSLQIEVEDKRNRIAQLNVGSWDKGGQIDLVLDWTNRIAMFAFANGLIMLTAFLITNAI
jgi:hypothetical protein